MPFALTRMPGLPVIVFVQSGKQVRSEAPSALPRLISALDTLPEPGYLIMDLRTLNIHMEDMAAMACLAALGPDALLHHPNLRETLIASADAMLRLAAQGMRTATYGNVSLRVFVTPEQALDYCREHIAAARAQTR